MANQKLAERKSLLVAQQAAWDKKKQARDSSGLNAAGQRARLGAGERPSRTGPRPARWLKQNGVRRPLQSQAADGAAVDARAEAKHRRRGILRKRRRLRQKREHAWVVSPGKFFGPSLRSTSLTVFDSCEMLFFSLSCRR